MRRPKWIVFFDTFWTRDTPFETTIENGNEGEMEKKMEEFEERPSSRARREGQDLHHLTVVSRCLVCRWSLRGRWNNIAFSSSWHAGCNGRTAPRRRNCAPSRLVFAASRTAWRTAIPRPSRRTGTAIHDFVCVFVCFFFLVFGSFRFHRRCVDGDRQSRHNNTNKWYRKTIAPQARYHAIPLACQAVSSWWMLDGMNCGHGWSLISIYRMD